MYIDWRCVDVIDDIDCFYDLTFPISMYWLMGWIKMKWNEMKWNENWLHGVKHYKTTVHQ
jgi:hypothetical protein